MVALPGSPSPAATRYQSPKLTDLNWTARRIIKAAYLENVTRIPLCSRPANRKGRCAQVKSGVERRATGRTEPALQDQWVSVNRRGPQAEHDRTEDSREPSQRSDRMIITFSSSIKRIGKIRLSIAEVCSPKSHLFYLSDQG
jgi:hypothetical protein